MTSIQRRFPKYLLVGASFIAYSACAGADESGADSAAEEAAAAEEASSQAGNAHWGYSGSTGPDQWAGLSGDFATCAGQSQSPIDILASAPASLPPLELRYEGNTTEVTNNGHTIQVNVGSGSSLLVDGRESDLLQFHFHSPSEHWVEGEQFPLEVHFVHANAAGELSVVGVLFRSGEEESGLASIWADFPETDQSIPLTVPTGSLGFVPAGLSSFRYDGSLTTPPCSEGVSWYVLESTSTVTPDEVAAFVAMVGENARPPQALNARSVVR